MEIDRRFKEMEAKAHKEGMETNIQTLNNVRAEVYEKFGMLRENFKETVENLMRAYISINFTNQHVNLKEFLNEFEKGLIEYALQFSMGNQKRAACLLGLKPSSLCEKIKKYHIK